MTKSDPSASLMSVVALRLRSPPASNDSISLSAMGDDPRLMRSTFSGTMSMAVTSCFRDMRTARERPT